MPRQLYSAADVEALAAYAAAALRVAALEDRAACEADRSAGSSPWGRLVGQQVRVLAAIGSRLGLDPVSRSRLGGL